MLQHPHLDNAIQAFLKLYSSCETIIDEEMSNVIDEICHQLKLPIRPGVGITSKHDDALRSIFIKYNGEMTDDALVEVLKVCRFPYHGDAAYINCKVIPRIQTQWKFRIISSTGSSSNFVKDLLGYKHTKEADTYRRRMASIYKFAWYERLQQSYNAKIFGKNSEVQSIHKELVINNLLFKGNLVWAKSERVLNPSINFLALDAKVKEILTNSKSKDDFLKKCGVLYDEHKVRLVKIGDFKSYF